MKGVERHPYLVVIDGKVWGDKDGKEYRYYHTVIEKLKIEK